MVFVQVAALKHEKIGKVEESMLYMYKRKQATVSDVKTVEDSWRRLRNEEQTSFLGHAHENHEKIGALATLSPPFRYHAPCLVTAHVCVPGNVETSGPVRSFRASHAFRGSTLAPP